VRNTIQRNLILDIINNSCDHLTAEEVYDIARKSISNISLGTVYRNLNQLTELQKIWKIKTFDGKDHYDKLHIKHNHFICLKCNKIFDILEISNIEHKNIPDDFEIVNYDITYSGYCNECKKGR
jgi:Fur family transcriptional regulator, peroxide stress response regulator